MRVGESGLTGGLLVLGHGAHDPVEDGLGAFEWNRVGSDNTENANEGAMYGELIVERTEADGGRHESFVLTPLTRLQAFVGVAERRASESEGAAAEVIGLDEGAESWFHAIF